MQTLTLARHTQGHITAVDLFPEFLERLDHCWLDNYYRPNQERFKAFLERHRHPAAARELVEAEQKEIEMYERYKAYYSYAFYIAQKRLLFHRMTKLTTALTRKPGKNFATGITTSSLGKPDVAKALLQHESYCRALEKCGLTVSVLDADKRYPDGCFVEDTAVVTEKMAVITRPGDPARRGEEEEIAELLAKHRKIERIEPPGTVDGGDLLRVGNHFYIGRSRRTNQAGAKQLADILSTYEYTSSDIQVQHVLHLKTGITWLGVDTFIAIDAFATAIDAAKVVRVVPEEAYAANCLLINDHLLMPNGFPKTKPQLLSLGNDLIEVDMSEFRKMDGGLTCLSLLF